MGKDKVNDLEMALHVSDMGKARSSPARELRRWSPLREGVTEYGAPAMLRSSQLEGVAPAHERGRWDHAREGVPELAGDVLVVSGHFVDDWYESFEVHQSGTAVSFTYKGK